MVSWIIAFSNHLNTQETSNYTVHINPLSLACVPDHFKTLEMCERAIEDESEALEHTLIALKAQGFVKEPLKINQTP